MKTLLFLSFSLLLVSVAKAQTCKQTIPASTPNNRFIISGNEVTDTKTNLIWQRCSLGQSGNNCSGGSANTYSWQEALVAASKPWRLPNINELRSIVEEKCALPAINMTVFPNTDAYSNYWSSSPYARNPEWAWVVEFYDGHSLFFDKYISVIANVRLVRDRL